MTAAGAIGEARRPRLELENQRARRRRRDRGLRRSLEVRGGEIVGIAGVSGNGQRELVEVLAGQREAESGEIRVNGEVYHAGREEMRRHKMCCCRKSR